MTAKTKLRAVPDCAVPDRAVPDRGESPKIVNK